jgi:hypothetical protein
MQRHWSRFLTNFFRPHDHKGGRSVDETDEVANSFREIPQMIASFCNIYLFAAVTPKPLYEANPQTPPLAR